MARWRWRTVGSACLAVAACGGGGPGVEGPEALLLFAQYSGTWVLDTLSSDPPPRLPEAGSGARGGRGDPFGGGGGRPGAPPPDVDGRRGGGGGPSGPPNMAAMRATLELASHRATRLQLELTDSVFAVAERRGRETRVPMNGDEVDLDATEPTVRAKVSWDDRRPRLERRVDGGGRVVDRYETLGPDRLLIIREFDGGPSGAAVIRLVYEREGPGS